MEIQPEEYDMDGPLAECIDPVEHKKLPFISSEDND